LYSCATVLAFPSRYEGFGLTVLEAMACGTPVVCSNSSSLSEVAGEAALLLQPDQPAEWAQVLLRVVTDDVLRRRLSGQGLARAARFSWEATARQVVAVYEQARLLRR
jgi:glycosyltransferase involved in cell wall biosynthesis